MSHWTRFSPVTEVVLNETSISWGVDWGTWDLCQGTTLASSLQPVDRGAVAVELGFASGAPL